MKWFLVADTQLYKRLCPSVGPSVGPPGISQKMKSQVNSTKFKKIQKNSFILTFIGHIFVHIKLVYQTEAILLKRQKIQNSLIPQPSSFVYNF